MENYLIFTAILNALMVICFLVLCSNVSKLRKRICGVELTEKNYKWWEEKFAGGFDGYNKKMLQSIADGNTKWITYKGGQVEITEVGVQAAKKILKSLY
jgi:hypothetical protein